MEFDVRLISFYTTETQRFRSNSNISEAMDFAVLRNKHYQYNISTCASSCSCEHMYLLIQL